MSGATKQCKRSTKQASNSINKGKSYAQMRFENCAGLCNHEYYSMAPPSTCSSGWIAKLQKVAVPRNRINDCKAPRISQIACVHTTALAKSVTCVLNALFSMADDVNET